jgi:hypothetical protein
MKSDLAPVVERDGENRAISNPERSDATDSSRVEALARTIAVRLRLCSEDELLVLDDLLIRLEKGRDAYGPLDLANDDRDWDHEEYEEQLDAGLYRSFGRVKRRKAKAERLRCEAADELVQTNPVEFGLQEFVAAVPSSRDDLVYIETAEQVDDLLGAGSSFGARIKRRLPVVIRRNEITPAPLPPPLPDPDDIDDPDMFGAQADAPRDFDVSDVDRLPDVIPSDFEDDGLPF